MKTSDTAIRIVKGFEIDAKINAVNLRAFDDGYGNWTIGWGRVQGVKEGDVIDLATAERYLREDIGIAERAIARTIKAPLTQGEFDALVVWTFNLGGGNLAKSSIAKAINAGKKDQVPALWMQYIYATDQKTKKKVKSEGLVRRRRAELALWRELDTDDREEAIAIAPGSITNAAPGAIVNAVTTSWTLRGAIVAIIGWVGEKLGYVTGFFGEAAGELSKLQSATDPMMTVWKALRGVAPDILALLALVGVGIVVWRRIDAALTGKPG